MTRDDDPTTTAIEAQTAELSRLRAEVERLSGSDSAAFEKGYDQAVREVRDHLEGAGLAEAVAAIEMIFGKAKIS